MSIPTLCEMHAAIGHIIFVYSDKKNNITTWAFVVTIDGNKAAHLSTHSLCKAKIMIVPTQ